MCTLGLQFCLVGYFMLLYESERLIGQIRSDCSQTSSMLFFHRCHLMFAVTYARVLFVKN